MIHPTRGRSRLLLVLAAGLGAGSIVAFAGWPLGTLRVFRTQWPTWLVLLWDVALSMLFFLQHSGMLRRNARARMATVIPPIYQPALYAIASGLALVAITVLWQPSELRVLTLVGALRHVALAFSIGAVGLFVWGLRSLRAFDPLGLAPLSAHLRAKSPRTCDFIVRGAYRFVRHPLYLAIIVLFWSCPDVTADRLLFDVLWTAWIVAGTVMEEADLAAEIGEAYREYRRKVPMLIPWRMMMSRSAQEQGA